jgi:putative transcriptional regulator
MDSDAIKKFRQSLQLTQEEFARKLGISRSTVAKWECGDFRPSRLAMGQIRRLKDELTEGKIAGRKEVTKTLSGEVKRE